MKCSNCQHENPEEAVFCNKCGNKIELACPECSKVNPADSIYCNACGHSLKRLSTPTSGDLSLDDKIEKIQRYLPKGLTEKILSQRDRIEGEHKQVTVMFCDLEGFTPLSEKIGPEEAYAIMDQVYEILIHKVHDFEGTVNEMTGDGIMALFGAPISLEDAPQRAIHSSLAIHREMAAFSDRLKQAQANISSLKMRIGIHTGPVVVGTLGNDLRVEFKAVGDTVNLASRMEKLAHAGSTCITENSFNLTEGLFQFEALGEREIKGKEAPVRIYRVLGPSSRRTRFDVSTERGLTPFVGRERELELLMDGFERSRTGRGQALSITGEAGLGKSRLLYEFRKAIANEDVTFFEGKCLSYSRNVAYHPVIDILKSNFLISESDNDAEITTKVKNDLKTLEVDEASTLPYLLELLSVRQSEMAEQSLTPEIMKDRIIEALNRILIKGSQRRPLVLAIEDLHWVDKSSEEAFKTLLDTISGARVFIIFTYRPEFVHTWGGKSYHSQVNLNRLSNRQSLAMAANQLGTKGIDSDLEDLILEKTEGVPFFIEEFIKSLVSLKIIERRDNTYRIAGDHRKLTLPTTIHDVIMARVDSLPDGAKEVLQTGSVIEREFSYELIKTVTELPEPELLSNLSALKDFELLYERGIYPQSTYVFKHALTQEVAYSSLLKKRKREIHDKIAGAIEGLYPQRLEEFYEKLASHYSESDNFEKACEYLKLSGKKAAEKYSNLEAFRFYKELIQMFKQLPDTEINKKEQIKATLLISNPMRYLFYPESSLGILEDGMRLSEEIDDKKNIAFFYSLIGKYYVFKGEPLKGRKYQEDLFYKAAEFQDIDIMAPISDDLNSSYVATGDFQKLIEISEPVINLLEETKRESEFFGRTTCIYTTALVASGCAEAYLGNFKESERLINKGLSYAQKIGHLYSIGLAEHMYALYFFLKGNGKSSIKHHRQVIKYYKDAQTVNWLGLAYLGLGYGYYFAGDFKNASKFIEEGNKIHKELGTSIFDSFYFLVLGCVHFATGDLEKAQKCYENSARSSQKIGMPYYEGWSRIWLGRTLGKIDLLKKDKAVEHILKGIEILKTIKSKPIYSKGYLFLGELYINSGQRAKAQEYLKKAEDNFREMEMDYWLDETRSVLEEL